MRELKIEQKREIKKKCHDDDTAILPQANF